MRSYRFTIFVDFFKAPGFSPHLRIPTSARSQELFRDSREREGPNDAFFILMLDTDLASRSMRMCDEDGHLTSLRRYNCIILEEERERESGVGVGKPINLGQGQLYGV